MQQMVSWEVDLVRRALAGDQGSWDIVAGLIRDRVYPYLSRMTTDEERAQDLTQETLLAVVKSLGGLKRPDRFWPWVFAIATNKTRQCGRSDARWSTTSLSWLADGSPPPVVDHGPSVLAALETKESTQMASAAMAKMSERHRLILALRVLEGYSHAQIARFLGCTELSARTAFFRARHALRRELERCGLSRGALAA